jgi:hypothetical protein
MDIPRIRFPIVGVLMAPSFAWFLSPAHGAARRAGGPPAPQVVANLVVGTNTVIMSLTN